MKTWVTKSTVTSNWVYIWYTRTKPQKNDYGDFTGKAQQAFICRNTFKKVFGFAPKDGECLLVEFSAKLMPEPESGVKVSK